MELSSNKIYFNSENFPIYIIQSRQTVLVGVILLLEVKWLALALSFILAITFN